MSCHLKGTQWFGFDFSTVSTARTARGHRISVDWCSEPTEYALWSGTSVTRLDVGGKARRGSVCGDGFA